MLGKSFFRKALMGLASLSLPGSGMLLAQEDPTLPAKPAEAKSDGNSKEADATKVATPPKKARPAIYDESTNATTQIELALAKAKKENRRVLVQWGANWCGWCHLLHDTFRKDPEVRRKILYEYDLVLVDVGQFDKNLDLVGRFEADIRKQGLPYLTILDSDGKVVCNQETSSLEKPDKEKPGHDAPKIVELLTQYQAEPIEATPLLSDALQKAKATDRLVFLHFGAPWCGWCHRLEDWMAEPEVASLLDKAFVDLKIDTDRMVKGDELLKQYCKKQEGIPWFVFLKPNQEAPVVTSSGPDGNIGFPSADNEIQFFVKMLQESQTRLTSEEIEQLKRSLVKNREVREAKAKEAQAQREAEAKAAKIQKVEAQKAEAVPVEASR